MFLKDGVSNFVENLGNKHYTVLLKEKVLFSGTSD